MEIKTILKNYRQRLVKEGIINAVLCGLIAGLAANAVFALSAWLFGIEQVWIGAIVFAVVAAATSVLFYFFKFRPSDKAIAARVDSLGLQERILTMNELQGDDSYIARRQREDAIASLNTVNAGLVKVAVSVPLIISLSVVFLFSAGATTVSALSANGAIKSGSDIISNEETAFEVVYDVEGTGSIYGIAAQTVEKGEDASAVVAVPGANQVFAGWSDGLATPYRQDLDVQTDIDVYAIFQDMDDLGEDDDINDDKKQYDPNGKPTDGGESDPDAPPNESSGDDSWLIGPKNGDGSSGEYSDSNQFLNGETYYGGANFQNYQDDAIDSVSQDSDAGDELIGIIVDYFDTIAQ